MTENPNRRISGRQRDKYGVTVTFTTDDGPLTLHAVGKVSDALRECCARAEHHFDSPKVVCISTPETIAGDLGKRVVTNGRHNIGAAITNSMLKRAGRERFASEQPWRA